MKSLVVFIVFALIALAAWLGYASYQKQQIAKIKSFEECAAAGYPIMESYPPQCRTSDGRSFTLDVGNELEYINEIIIENPRPNQKISSPLRISGRARGTWFFEADFPIELLDVNNKSLGIGHAQAQGEWMTENFVPFEGKILFEKPAASTGKLVIRNANPSGLEENQKELIIPVTF